MSEEVNNPKNLGEALTYIIQNYGSDTLRDGSRALSMVSDLIPMRTQDIEMLQKLIDCQGHLVLLNAAPEKANDAGTYVAMKLEFEQSVSKKNAEQLCRIFLDAVYPERKTAEQKQKKVKDESDKKSRSNMKQETATNTTRKKEPEQSVSKENTDRHLQSLPDAGGSELSAEELEKKLHDTLERLLPSCNGSPITLYPAVARVAENFSKYELNMNSWVTSSLEVDYGTILGSCLIVGSGGYFGFTFASYGFFFLDKIKVGLLGDSVKSRPVFMPYTALDQMKIGKYKRLKSILFTDKNQDQYEMVFPKGFSLNHENICRLIAELCRIFGNSVQVSI